MLFYQGELISTKKSHDAMKKSKKNELDNRLLSHIKLKRTKILSPYKNLNYSLKCKLYFNFHIYHLPLLTSILK